MNRLSMFSILIVTGTWANVQPAQAQSQRPAPACEWCGTAEAPKELTWDLTIADATEPGEPIVIEGTVFKPDGRTPAPDVVIYTYHTNAAGIYPKRGNDPGNAVRHGYLRG